MNSINTTTPPRFDGLYAGADLPLAGGTMSGIINMNNQSIIGLPTPTGTGHATSKTYVDTAVATKLPLAGGTLTGNLLMSGTNQVKNLLAGSANNDAVTVSQVRTGTLGRTAWVSGELIKRHIMDSGYLSPTVLTNNVIPVNTTQSLFGTTAFAYTPLVQNSKLVLEFVFEIASSSLQSGFTTQITHQGLSQGFLNNCAGSVGTRGQQVIFKTIHLSPAPASSYIAVTISTTTTQAGTSTLTVNQGNWTLCVYEYAS